MDRLLDTLGIGILDLLETKEIQEHAELPRKESVERIALVSPENAALARFSSEQILETRSFNKSFLRRLKAARRRRPARLAAFRGDSSGIERRPADRLTGQRE